MSGVIPEPTIHAFRFNGVSVATVVVRETLPVFFLGDISGMRKFCGERNNGAVAVTLPPTSLEPFLFTPT